MAKKEPEKAAAKVGPVKYIGQVRQEARKVTWPTGRETFTTTVLVMFFVILFGAFFFIVDIILANGVEFILGIGAGA